MFRRAIAPRTGWQATVESQGLIFHTGSEGSPYWDESAFYQFTSDQIAVLERATTDVLALCLEAGQRVIDEKLYDRFAIPPAVVPLIERAWEAEPPSVYGRFDLAYDGRTPPKLLEFNADTPTALLEAAVIQWYWLQDVDPQADQFNSIHERLVAKWKELKGYMKGPTLHLAAVRDSWEDEMTCAYMADCADQAGIATRFLYIDDLGWDGERQELADVEGETITDIFKLYPWEWLAAEEFAPHLAALEATTQWIEPIWKMLWSNKAVLALLWEMFPGHENLLPAFLDGPRNLAGHVRKPLFGREGANVAISTPTLSLSTEGTYADGPFVWQAYVDLPEFDGRRPVIGSWVIDGEAAGIGIREAAGPVTGNESRFVPHLFR